MSHTNFVYFSVLCKQFGNTIEGMHKFLLALQFVPTFVTAIQTTMPAAPPAQKKSAAIDLVRAAAGIAEEFPNEWAQAIGRVIDASVTIFWSSGIFTQQSAATPATPAVK